MQTKFQLLFDSIKSSSIDEKYKLSLLTALELSNVANESQVKSKINEILDVYEKDLNHAVALLSTETELLKIIEELKRTAANTPN